MSRGRGVRQVPFAAVVKDLHQQKARDRETKSKGENTAKTGSNKVQR